MVAVAADGDLLDRLELMIVIEDRFTDVVITDEEVDQLEVVGDLIRHIESVDHERR
jgi:acyl carrier protein